MSAAEQLRDWAPGSWRHHLLHGFGDRPLSERRDAEGRAGRVRLRDLSPRIGQAWFPLVSPTDTVPRAEVPGVLACVRVGVGRDPVPPEAAARIAAWVAGLVGDAHLDAPALFFDNIPASWTVEGRSYELAAAIALLTHLLGSPARGPLIFSACLAGACQLDAVSHLDTKTELSRREAPNARCYFVGEARPPLLDEWLPDGWRRDLSQVLRASPDAASARLRDALRRGDRPATARHARLALAARAPTCRVEAHRALGAEALHRGDTEAGLDHLRCASSLLQQSGPALRFQPEELDAQVAIGLLDDLDPVGAEAVLRPALDRLDAVSPSDRFARWRDVAVQVAGSLRRSLVALDRLEEAWEIQQTWSLGAAAVAPERSRCELDLADVQLRSGCVDEALEALQRARAHLPDAWSEARPLTLRFLRLQEVRAALQKPAPYRPGTGPDWTDWPQPLELAASIAALPRAHVEAALQSWTIPDSPVMCWVSSAVAADLVARHGLLPWCQEALTAMRPLVDDARMGTGAVAALESALDEEPRAWRRRVPY